MTKVFRQGYQRSSSRGSRGFTELGEGVKELRKKLHELSETKAGVLVEKHSEVLSQAYQGTALTIIGEGWQSIDESTIFD
jgi:hypothetical protein